MKSKVIFTSAVVLCSNFALADFKFSETFNGYTEGAKLSTNIVDKAAAPVLWTDDAYVELVAFDKVKNYKGLEAVSLIQNPKITADSIPRAKTTESVLMFKYAAGADSWSEQRWAINQAVLGKKGLSDIWMQYDVYIPSNYFLVDNLPTSLNYFGAGHKVNVFYGDGYSSPYTTMVWGELIARRTATGEYVKDYSGWVDATLSTYPNGATSRIDSNYSNAETRKREFKWMDPATDLGQWQRRTFHFKFPTSESSNDGVIEVWIKRADGTISKAMDFKSKYGYSRNYFNGGYLNGYNNAGFSEAVNMLVDNVIIADNMAAIDQGAIYIGSKILPPAATLKY